MAKKATDNWQQLLKNVEPDDGLPTRETGSWTFDKLWWWNRYIGITTRAMADKPHWNGLTSLTCLPGRESAPDEMTNNGFPDRH